MKNDIVRVLNKKFYYNDTARFLLSYISGRKVLSVGCGSGNIERARFRIFSLFIVI